MRADYAHQLAQRGHAGDPTIGWRAPRFGTRLFRIRRTPQRNAVVRSKFNQHHAEHARTLGTRLPVQMKRLARRYAVCFIQSGFFTFLPSCF